MLNACMHAQAAVVHDMQIRYRDSEHYRRLGLHIWNHTSEQSLEMEDEQTTPPQRCLCCFCPSVFLNEDGACVRACARACETGFCVASE